MAPGRISLGLSPEEGGLSSLCVRNNVWMVSVLGQSQESQNRIRKITCPILHSGSEVAEYRPSLTSPSSASSLLQEIFLEWSFHICDLTFSKGFKLSSLSDSFQRRSLGFYAVKNIPAPPPGFVAWGGLQDSGPHRTCCCWLRARWEPWSC